MVSATGQVLPGEQHRGGRVADLLRSSAFVLSQIVLLGLLYVLYDLGRHLAAGRELEALRHAVNVWHLERVFDLPDEASLQAVAMRSSRLLELANRFYMTVHFPAAITFLLWVLIFQRHTWSRVRTVIAMSTGVALMIHIVYPLAPPRFLPEMLPSVKLVDTGAVFGPSPYGSHDTVANQYAAMPSLHIGWAILEAWGVITILRVRVRWLALLHPIVTTLVVVITANHYWLDGIIGGGLVAAAVQITRPEVQSRIRLWAIACHLPVGAPAVGNAPGGTGTLPAPRRPTASGPARTASTGSSRLPFSWPVPGLCTQRASPRTSAAVRPGDNADEHKPVPFPSPRRVGQPEGADPMG
ncbi:phosphatase PAP2 family protein [Frankia sp. AiPa1]|uniref:phosphatase PAP2 family protein n=1 Tax=Frankia sp. AiPa1 TaxID=573492 RepID=UPI00202AEFD9|nr:phosphatase PAP2 family protein [Frankia sp. AiPa1]MCL9759137.1 phosphatase PAP2 family protein [Frankia sp. AiPa1]